MFVSCMVFSCVARLFRLMDFRTRYTAVENLNPKRFYSGHVI